MKKKEKDLIFNEIDAKYSIDQNHLITDQTFDSKEGSASAMLSSEIAPFVNVDLNKISLTFLINGSAKKIIGCNNLVTAVPNQSN